MFKNKLISVLLISVLLIGLFAGCATTNKTGDQDQPDTSKEPDKTEEPKGEKVTLNFSWWGEKERHDGTLSAIEFWNEQNPDIQVEPYFSGWDGYHDKLGTQFAGKNAPDIFQYSADRMQEYASKDLLVPFDEYIDSYFKDIDQGLWAPIEYEGKHYGVASGLNGGGLVYNKTKLEELGIELPTDEETWDSLLEKAKQATRDTDGDGEIDFWGIQDPIDQPLDGIMGYLRNNGLQLWSEDLQSSNFDDPEVIEALKKLGKFSEAGVCPGPDAVTLKEGQNYIDAGYVAFDLGGSLSSFGGTQANTTDELGFVMTPRVAGMPFTKPVEAGLPLGIYSGSKHTEEALKFLSWLLTDPEAAKASGMVRGIFPSKTQRDATVDNFSIDEQKTFRLANVISTFATDEVIKKPLNVGEFEKILIVERDKYSFGQVTLEEYLANVKKNADPVLKVD